MSHNIAGSEVGRRRPIAYLTVIARGRRRGWTQLVDQLKAAHRAVWLHLAMIPLGIVLGLVDALAIGKPYTIVVAVLVLVAWRFWPTRR